MRILRDLCSQVEVLTGLSGRKVNHKVRGRGRQYRTQKGKECLNSQKASWP